MITDLCSFERVRDSTVQDKRTKLANANGAPACCPSQKIHLATIRTCAPRHIIPKTPFQEYLDSIALNMCVKRSWRSGAVQTREWYLPCLLRPVVIASSQDIHNTWTDREDCASTQELENRVLCYSAFEPTIAIQYGRLCDRCFLPRGDWPEHARLAPRYHSLHNCGRSCRKPTVQCYKI